MQPESRGAVVPLSELCLYNAVNQVLLAAVWLASLSARQLVAADQICSCTKSVVLELVSASRPCPPRCTAPARLSEVVLVLQVPLLTMWSTP